MPVYEFFAVDIKGKTSKGFQEASSEKELRALLRTTEKTLIESKIVKESSGFTLFTPRLNSKQRSMFFRKLASLISPDMPIDKALEMTASQNKKKFIDSMITDLISKVRTGKSLSVALGAYPKSFPPLYLASVKAGEESDSLKNVLETLATHSEQADGNRQKIKSAMAYPTIVLAVAFAITTYLMVSVVPNLTSIFMNNGKQLPAITVAMLSVSQFLSKYWLGMMMFAVASVILYNFAVAKPAMRLRVDRIKYHCIGIRNIVRAIEGANYMSTLAMLVNAGVPLSAAMSISSKSVTNLHARNLLDASSMQVNSGKTLSDELYKTGLLTPSMAHFVEIGERTDSLGKFLFKAAHDQEEVIKLFTKNIITYIEPISMVLMGGVVITIAMATLLPIFEMNNFY